jgi:anti-sigma factor RsiW
MICAGRTPALIQYWLGELADADEQALEEHLFDCDACAGISGEVADLVDALRERVPATLTEAAIARLEQRGVRMRHTRIRPGERVSVPFGPDVDLLVHRLQIDLAAIERIDVEAASAGDGTILVAVPDVMFEPGRGEVNVVCFRHYAEALPPDAALRLVAVEPTGRRVVGEYGVMHLIPGR